MSRASRATRASSSTSSPAPTSNRSRASRPPSRSSRRASARVPAAPVGTITEIADSLRLLFARAGTAHCWQCGAAISQQGLEEMVDRVLALPEGTKIQVLAPVVRGRKGQYKKELEQFRRDGFARARIDGTMRDLAEDIVLARGARHDIEIVVDRIAVKPGVRPAPRGVPRDGTPPGGRSRLDRRRRRERRRAGTSRREGRGVRLQRRKPLRRPLRTALRTPLRTRGGCRAPGRVRPARSRFPSSRRGSSRSTIPSAPARPAAGSASSPGSTRAGSSPIRRAPSPRGRSPPST
jgi:hypothetical protein